MQLRNNRYMVTLSPTCIQEMNSETSFLKTMPSDYMETFTNEFNLRLSQEMDSMMQ